MTKAVLANRDFTKYPAEVHLGYKDETISRDDFFLGYVADILDKHVKAPAAPRILEWGTGFSTFLFHDFVSRHGDGSFTTIDNNKPYQEAFLACLEAAPFFFPVIRNEVGPTRSFDDPGLHYASHPVTESETYDLVFIDGRRRMECLLNTLMLCAENTCVVVDDGLRTRYQIASLLFDVVEEMGHGVVYRIRPSIHNLLKDDVSALRQKIAQSLG